MTFHPGQSGNPAGRRRGVKNKRTVEIEQVAKRLLEDPGYQECLRQRLYAGEAGHIETLLYYYAYGRPVERYEDISPPGRIEVCWDEGPTIYLPTNGDVPDLDSNGHGLRHAASHEPVPLPEVTTLGEVPPVQTSEPLMAPQVTVNPPTPTLAPSLLKRRWTPI
jgi:hypothetical protein